VADMIDAYLYTASDVYVSDLTSDYSFNDYLEVQSTGSQGWITYYGDRLASDLPVGAHYIELSFCGKTYYSEIINICEMTNLNIDSDTNLITSWINGAHPDEFDSFSSTDNEFYVAETTGEADAYSNEIENIEIGDTITINMNLDISIGSTDDFWIQMVDSDYNAASDRGDISNGCSTETLTATAAGPLRLHLRKQDNVNEVEVDGIMCAYLNTRENLFDGYINLQWNNECNLNDILYQTGFSNRLTFAKKTDLMKSEYEIVKEADRLDGYLNVHKVTVNKSYKLSFLAPEYMADAMNLLPSHDTKYITTKDGDRKEIKEVDISADPYNSCFYRIMLTIVIEPISSSNCCEEYSLTDIS